jgi:peptidoglycan/xylan/chitin deacetylase (PgdA/CDA1 family)
VKNIYLLHGCCQKARAHIRSERNFVSVDTLWQYLKSRPKKFGSLGVDGTHDVLTVDDATNGAAIACAIAREAGHSVTVFVNPYQIETQREYWFTQLDAILDTTTARRTIYEDRLYELDSPKAEREFRLSVKARLMRLAADDTDLAIKEIASSLGVDEFEVPVHGRVLRPSELVRLRNLGVSVENHGWDHKEIAACNSSDVASEIERARTWIQTHIGGAVRHYAVPYGLTRLDSCARKQIEGLVLLADQRDDLGAIGGRHWNRLDITGQLRRDFE